jgi:hypothetical protein
MTEHIDPATFVSFAGWPRSEVNTFLKTIGRFVGAQVKPLQKEIAELKARLEEVEKRGVEYQGVYQRAQSYRRGALTTYDGSLWACVSDAEPNEAPPNPKWQLCAKAGRDAPRQPTTGSGRRV